MNNKTNLVLGTPGSYYQQGMIMNIDNLKADLVGPPKVYSPEYQMTKKEFNKLKSKKFIDKDSVLKNSWDNSEQGNCDVITANKVKNI